MRMADIFKQLLKSLEEGIDKGEIEVIDMVTKEQEKEIITVESCKQVFALIEKSKLDLSLTTESILSWLGLMQEFVVTEASVKHVISNKFSNIKQALE